MAFRTVANASGWGPSCSSVGIRFSSALIEGRDPVQHQDVGDATGTVGDTGGRLQSQSSTGRLTTDGMPRLFAENRRPGAVGTCRAAVTSRPQRTVCTAGHRARTACNHGRAKGVPFRRTGRCTRCIVMRPTSLVRASPTSARDPTRRAHRRMCLRNGITSDAYVEDPASVGGGVGGAIDPRTARLLREKATRAGGRNGSHHRRSVAVAWGGRRRRSHGAAGNNLGRRGPTCAAESKWRASAVLCRCDHS